MKRFVYILLIVTFPIVGYGQTENWEKPSWWNNGKIVKWNKKMKDSVIINSRVSSLDSACMKFMNSNFFILRQDYCLYNKKEDELYGYDDQDCFGTTYSLGIKCRGFNIVSDMAIRPWEYDEKYKQYKSDELTPQVTKSWYRNINDTISLGYSQLDTIVSARKTIKDNSCYISSPFITSHDGFVLNTQDTCKTGKVVWLIVEKENVDSVDLKVDFTINQINTDMHGSKTITPPIGKLILGGIFITEQSYEEKDFCLGGIITKIGDDWVLEFPFKGFNEIPTKKGRLTRITKDKEKDV